MGIFKRRNGTTDVVDTELVELRKRKSALQAKLADVERDLAQAIEDRRHRLLEADLDSNDGEPVRDIVAHIRDSRDAIIDALAGIDGRIIAAEQRLDQERDQIARKAESEARAKQLATLEAARMQYEAGAKALVEAFENVTGPLPQSAHLQMLIARTAADLLGGTAEAAAQLKGYITAVTTPGAPLFQQAPPVAAPRPPVVQRRSILLLKASRWNDPQHGIMTAGAMRTVEVPTAIADSALQFGHALTLDNSRAKQLLANANASAEIDYAVYSTRDPTLVDLEEPPATLPAPASHVRPVKHTGGVATVAMPAR